MSAVEAAEVWAEVGEVVGAVAPVALVAVVVSPVPLFDAPCFMSVAVVCTVRAPPEDGATTVESR